MRAMRECLDSMLRDKPLMVLNDGLDRRRRARLRDVAQARSTAKRLEHLLVR